MTATNTENVTTLSIGIGLISTGTALAMTPNWIPGAIFAALGVALLSIRQWRKQLPTPVPTLGGVTA